MQSTLAETLLVVLWLAAILLIMLVAGTGKRKGLWRAHRSGTGLVWFESDLGRFGVTPSGQLRIQLPGVEERTLPLGEVDAVRFSYARHTSRQALEDIGVHVWSKGPAFDVLDVFDRWGLVADIQADARAVVDDLQREFAQRGHPLRLA